MNKKIKLLILSVVLTLPALTSAATIRGIADAAVNTTLYIASAVVVILWVVTGLLFLTAQGDVAKIGTAKKALFAAIAGTVLVIIAKGALGFVGNALGI